MEIAGKTALITGGASGIGATTARMLAARGANLVLVDVNQQLRDETVKAIEAVGARAIFVRADVRDEGQMRQAFDDAVGRFGSLDIVFNNAGIATPQPGFTRIAVEQWKRVLDIDLLGVVLGCYLAFPLMRERGGVIVNTASMAGVYPIPGDPVYSAAKAGVIHLTHSLAYWSKRRIRINCVSRSGRYPALAVADPRGKGRRPSGAAGAIAIAARGNRGSGAEIHRGRQPGRAGSRGQAHWCQCNRSAPRPRRTPVNSMALGLAGGVGLRRLASRKPRAAVIALHLTP
jgi:NAD(P)-dependent dehydrogenase (short-subunit alcohol dehydrogenase family)